MADKSKSYRRLIITITLIIIGALGLSELGLRLFGLLSTPLYYASDGPIGYGLVPNQTGSFINSRNWSVNNIGLMTKNNWKINKKQDVLLIGNSIVMGGNSYTEDERLTPVLEKYEMGSREIWPAAVGGWSAVNEMGYLDLHPALVSDAEFFAWELMDGSFGGEKKWTGETFFPTKQPFSALWVLLNRYVYSKFLQRSSNGELPPVLTAVDQNFERFKNDIQILSGKSEKVNGCIWLYPKLDDLRKARSGQEWFLDRARIDAIARAARVPVLDLAARSDWNETLYSFDGVHPSPQGNKVIARFLVENCPAFR